MNVSLASLLNLITYSESVLDDGCGHHNLSWDMFVTVDRVLFEDQLVLV